MPVLLFFVGLLLSLKAAFHLADGLLKNTAEDTWMGVLWAFAAIIVFMAIP